MSPSVKLPIACLIFSTFPYTVPSWALCMLLSDVFCSTESFVCSRRVIGRSRFCPRWCRGYLRWTTCWRTAQMAVPSPPCCTFTVPPSSAWEVQKPAKPSKILRSAQRVQCVGAVKSKPTVFTYTCCYCTQISSRNACDMQKSSYFNIMTVDDIFMEIFFHNI